jgi:hypothetical protein
MIRVQILEVFVIFIMLCISIGLSITGVSYILGAKQPDNEKVSVYECGFDPFESSISIIQYYHHAICLSQPTYPSIHLLHLSFCLLISLEQLICPISHIYAIHTAWIFKDLSIKLHCYCKEV